jgi:leader peptidase (prepilin peptidase)/N-methyltransferase
MLSGAWFGWKGALFALLAGAIQGTVVALVVLIVKGRIEEPAAVKRERLELLQQLEMLEGDARRELEAELALDPLGSEPGEGLGKARLPFGPFLAIATIEYLLFGDALVQAYWSMLWVG